MGDSIDESDILAIDKLGFTVIDQLRSVESMPGMTAQMFNDYMAEERWTVCGAGELHVARASSADLTGADGKSRPIVPGGENMAVTWDNRTEYVRALVAFRLNEFKIQCDAIKQGLFTVVPYNVLPLLTWEELQEQVTGKPSECTLPCRAVLVLSPGRSRGCRAPQEDDGVLGTRPLMLPRPTPDPSAYGGMAELLGE